MPRSQYPLSILDVVPRTELVIEQGDKQLSGQRLEGGIVSLISVGLFVWMWLPDSAVVVLAQYFGVSLGSRGDGGVGMRQLVGAVALAVALLLGLLLWAVVNWARFSGVERRRAVPTITVAEQAARTPFTEQHLQECQACAVVELYFEGSVLREMVGRAPREEVPRDSIGPAGASEQSQPSVSTTS